MFSIKGDEAEEQKKLMTFFVCVLKQVIAMFLSLLRPPQKADGRYKILQRGLNFVLLDTAQEKSKKCFVTTLANNYNF